MDIDIQHITSNKRPYRKMKPNSITIHSTGNPRSTPQNERDWLMNASNKRTASWHYVVGEDTIIEAIPPTEVAWHSGTTKGNNTSISIEMVHTGNREKVIDNTLKLTKYLQKKFNIANNKVLRHFDWSKKNCPSILNYSDWQGWKEFKSRLEEGSVLDTMTKEELKKFIQEVVREELRPSLQGENAEWAKDHADNLNKKFPGSLESDTDLKDYMRRGQVIALVDKITDMIK